MRNAGIGDAVNVHLNDPLPNVSGGLNWGLSPAVTGCFVDNANLPSQVLKCNQLSVPAGGSQQLIVSTPITPQACGQMDNTATITGTNNTLVFALPGLQSSGQIACTPIVDLTID